MQYQRTISIDVLKETSNIVFNTAKLTLGEAKVSSSALKQTTVVASASFSIDEENERATVQLPTALPAGSKLELKIDFEGELTGAMMGYYKSAWEHEGKTKYYSLTQFEVK